MDNETLWTNSGTTEDPALTLKKLEEAYRLLQMGLISNEAAAEYAGCDFEEEVLVCVMCGNSDRCHFTDPTHPLFKDNLSYLAWKHEQNNAKR